MVEEVLVGGVLTDSMIGAGARLVQRLKDLGWPLEGAFWQLAPDASRWRLVLVSSRVDESGPRAAYEQVLTVLTKMSTEAPWVNLSDISVQSPSSHLVKPLRRMVRPPTEGTPPPLSGSRPGELLLPDLFVYRL